MASKRIVVCCDGTWDLPDWHAGVGPSNVSKLAEAVRPFDGTGRAQRVFYETGVGTGGIIDRAVGGAFGWGISNRILNAYRFVLEEYEPGDRLFFFGFSRGAYSVRSLAGLIRNCGVLRRSHRNQVGAAYNLYRRRDPQSHPDARESRLFRKTYAHDVRIQFIGVFETVGALGIPVGVPWLPISWIHWIKQRWDFHDVDLSGSVDNAYQAIAIDEKRPQYAPTLWHQQAHARGHQTLRQVWFAGTHKNVGGGFTDTGLSDSAMQWMVERAAEHGLDFDNDYLCRTLRPNALGDIQNSKTGIFILWPDAVRTMGCGDATFQRVRSTATKRMDAALDPPYRPQNLIDFLEAGGKVD